MTPFVEWEASQENIYSGTAGSVGPHADLDAGSSSLSKKLKAKDMYTYVDKARAGINATNVPLVARQNARPVSLTDRQSSLSRAQTWRTKDAKGVVQLAWNDKCVHGGPMPFDPEQALDMADFNESVYVNTSAKKGRTRQAFTFVNINGWRICVVGHIHPLQDGGYVAGNSYIPGWEGWEKKTPDHVCAVINGLPDGGVFPGDDRYPLFLGGDTASINNSGQGNKYITNSML